MRHRTVAYPTGMIDTLPIFFNGLRKKQDGSVPYRRSQKSSQDQNDRARRKLRLSSFGGVSPASAANRIAHRVKDRAACGAGVLRVVGDKDHRQVSCLGKGQGTDLGAQGLVQPRERFI